MAAVVLLKRRSVVTFSAIAVALGGCAPSIHSARGWGHLEEKNPDRAIEAFQRGGEGPGALVGLSHAYFQKGDYTKAEAFLDEAVRRYPNDWFVLFSKGQYCLDIKKEYDTAIQYLKRSQQLEQGSASKEIGLLIQEAKRKMADSQTDQLHPPKKPPDSRHKSIK